MLCMPWTTPTPLAFPLLASGCLRQHNRPKVREALSEEAQAALATKIEKYKGLEAIVMGNVSVCLA